MPPLPFVPTPIGRLWPLSTAAGLVAVERGDEPPMDLPAGYDDGASRVAADALEAWFAGATRALDLPLDLTGRTDFHRAVYAAARAVPYGETVSYGELAMMAGAPLGARAVGVAMARCRVSPVVPCHRVIFADGRLGGWGSNPTTKRWLLDHERRTLRGR